MNPTYDYEQNTRVFRGYRVSQQLAVVADLEGAGDIVPAIIAAAGNAARVSDLRLQVGDPETVLAEAREDARKRPESRSSARPAAPSGSTHHETPTLHRIMG